MFLLVLYAVENIQLFLTYLEKTGLNPHEEQTPFNVPDHFESINELAHWLSQAGAPYGLTFQVSEWDAHSLSLTRPVIMRNKADKAWHIISISKSRKFACCVWDGDQEFSLTQEEWENRYERSMITGILYHHKPHINPLKPVQRLYGFFKGERAEIKNIWFFSIIMGLINLIIPLGIQGIVGLISGGMLLTSVVVLIVLVISVTGAYGWLQVIQLQLVEVLQQRLFAKAAFEFGIRLPRIHPEALNGVHGPELVNRFFEVVSIQKAMPKVLIDITGALLQILFGLVLLSLYHDTFILLGLLLLALILLMFRLTGPGGIKTSLTESKSKYKLVFWLEEIARALPAFRQAGEGQLYLRHTDNHVGDYLNARNAHFKILKSQYSAFIVFKVIVTSALLLMGGFLVIEQQINLGQFVATEIIILLVLGSVEKLISSIDVVYDLLTSLDKIGSFTDLRLEKNGQVILAPDASIDLRLKDFSFTYPGTQRAVIRNMNMIIEPKKIYGFVGREGSGRSSLLNILAGQWPEAQGVWEVNGSPFRNLSFPSYRARVGFCQSPITLFAGTVAENVHMGIPGISHEQMMDTLRICKLSDWISQLTDGLATHVLPGGHEFPGHIRRKILLARALVNKPALLILDEPFTGPDLEPILLDLIHSPQRPAIAMCTHTQTLLQGTDHIYWLNEGVLQQEGTYLHLAQFPSFISLLQTHA